MLINRQNKKGRTRDPQYVVTQYINTIGQHSSIPAYGLLLSINYDYYCYYIILLLLWILLWILLLLLVLNHTQQQWTMLLAKSTSTTSIIYNSNSNSGGRKKGRVLTKGKQLVRLATVLHTSRDIFVYTDYILYLYTTAIIISSNYILIYRLILFPCFKRTMYVYNQPLCHYNTTTQPSSCCNIV